MLAFAAAFIVNGNSPSVSPSPTATPSIAPLPDGTYSYAFRVGSGTIGTTIISVARAGAATIRIHETVSLGGEAATIDQTLSAASFSPISADIASGSSAKLHVAIGGGVATTSRGVQTLSRMPLDTKLKGSVILGGAMMSGFFSAAAEAHALKTQTLFGIVPTANAVMLALAPSTAANRPPGAASGDAAFTVGLPSGDVTVWYDPASFVPDDFEVPAQTLSVVLVKRSAEPAMTATPQPAPTPLPTATPKFSSRDVTFRSSDGTALAGTLTLPDRRNAKFSAVVLVQGSGPVNRDEQVGPNPIFLQLSNALSNDGYVVLRYDKRGIGKSGGNARTATRDQLLADARAAIAYVAGLPSVNPHSVFVVGHSEGGELAPSLAASGAPLRGIALMAPPAIPLDRILLQQAARGLSGKAAHEARAAQERVNAAIRTGASNMPGAIWLRSSFGIDPAVVIEKVPCPILILQGGKDFQVLARDLPRLVDSARASRRDLTVRVFPNDDHLFITVPAGQQATPAEYMVPHHVDPAMISALLRWLDSEKQ